MTSDYMTEIRLDLLDSEDRSYTYRIVADKIAESGDVIVYLTDDERVIAYDAGEMRYSECADPESDLRQVLDDEQYVGLCQRLDLDPVLGP